MADASAHPVQTLREHATALEAAMSVCLSDPKVKAVHKIRTETRRIEAQLALLALIPNLPSYRKEANKVLKRLRKLRRAAGKVRDFDVQRKLIKEHAPTTNGAKPPGDGDRHLASDPKYMRKLRKRLREKAADDLLDIIRRHGPKVSAALEDLLALLEPAQGLNLSANELLRLVDRGFSHQPSLGIRNPSEDQLHDIRKAAKVARYQAENVPDSASARLAAQRYEQLQEQGGEWHDWLQLAAAAADELGKQHATATLFADLRDEHLATFRSSLESLPQRAHPDGKGGSSTPGKSGRRA
jgi:CHAD domain-containing protein